MCRSATRGDLGILTSFAALALVVRARRGPLPGDAPLQRAIQRVVLRHPPLNRFLTGVSSLTWPRPAFTGIGIASALLLVSRRPFAALSLATCTLLANDSCYHVSKVVRRPRPAGHGIRVQKRLRGTYAFPSGHVVHSTAALGYLLYLTRTGPIAGPLIWPLRLLAAVVVFSIGLSRVASGEHWPSDVLGGRLLGLLWLLGFIRLHRRLRRSPV